MKHGLKAVLVFGALALASPASAQLVNGLSGQDYSHEAPIGTKAGGSPSSLQAPGEANAIAGALRNEMEAKHMQSAKVAVVVPPKRVIPRARIALNDTAKERLDNGQE